MGVVNQHQAYRRDNDISSLFTNSDVVLIRRAEYNAYRVIPDDIYRAPGTIKGERDEELILLARMPKEGTSTKFKCPASLVPHLLGKNKARLKEMLTQAGIKSATVIKF